MARDPRGMLFLTGRLDLEAEAVVKPFEREIVPPQKTADYVLEVRQGGVTRFEHLEALARWHPRETEAILLRCMAIGSLEELKGRQMRLTVILLSEEHTPAELPHQFTGDWGALKTVVEPDYVEIWKEDGDRIVRSERLALLPWTPLMRTSKEALRVAGARLVAADDEQLRKQFVTLGSVRYDEEYLRSLLGRIGNMFTPHLAAQTPFGEKIVAIGLEKGREVGRREEAIRLIGTFLSHRHPGLATRVDAARLSEVADLDDLFERLVSAPDEASAWEEIQRAGAMRAE